MITDYHARYFAHDLTRRATSGMDRLSMALFDAAVDLNPHQIEAALFALQSPLSKGVILADEVGLGKTIEAGSGRNYVDEILVTGEQATVKKVEAVIEGRFDAKASTGCWRPKHHIAATKIELLSAVTDYNPAPTDETPLRTRH